VDLLRLGEAAYAPAPQSPTRTPPMVPAQGSEDASGTMIVTNSDRGHGSDTMVANVGRVNEHGQTRGLTSLANPPSDGSSIGSNVLPPLAAALRSVLTPLEENARWPDARWSAPPPALSHAGPSRAPAVAPLATETGTGGEGSASGCLADDANSEGSDVLDLSSSSSHSTTAPKPASQAASQAASHSQVASQAQMASQVSWEEAQEDDDEVGKKYETGTIRMRSPGAKLSLGGAGAGLRALLHRLSSHTSSSSSAVAASSGRAAAVGGRFSKGNHKGTQRSRAEAEARSPEAIAAELALVEKQKLQALGQVQRKYSKREDALRKKQEALRAAEQQMQEALSLRQELQHEEQSAASASDRPLS